MGSAHGSLSSVPALPKALATNPCEGDAAFCETTRERCPLAFMTPVVTVNLFQVQKDRSGHIKHQAG